MAYVFVICFIIIIVVLLLSVLTTSKAYKYEHKIDPLIKDEPDDSNKDHN